MNKAPIHLLNAFVVFNEAKNIGAAADLLKITQPALSKQLGQLEEFFPQKLFAMSGRKKVLTPFGRALHLRLQERLGNIHELVQETLTLHGQAEQATLRIAARRGILDRLSGKLPFPGAIFFQEASNDEVIRTLLSMDAEIGIVHSAPNTYELVTKPLFEEKFHIVIPKRFISKRPSFGDELLLELQNLPCLGYRPQDEILKALCEAVSLDVSNLRMIRATENYQSLAEMVDAKMGWALLPTYLEKANDTHWIVPIPEKILPGRRFLIAYRPEFGSVAWFRELLGEIRDCFPS